MLMSLLLVLCFIILLFYCHEKSLSFCSSGRPRENTPNGVGASGRHRGGETTAGDKAWGGQRRWFGERYRSCQTPRCIVCPVVRAVQIGEDYGRTGLGGTLAVAPLRRSRPRNPMLAATSAAPRLLIRVFWPQGSSFLATQSTSTSPGA